IIRNFEKKIIIALLTCLILLPTCVYAIDNVPDAPENTIAVGVDISYHNGTIDFEQLATEVNFVILRCGYGSDYISQDDANFETYVKSCVEYNIPFGVYLYSYADTVAKGKSEGEHALRLVEQAVNEWGATLSLPVFFDMENSGTLGTCNASTKAAIAQAFCTVLEDAGYTTGIYANKYWWTTYLTDSYFDDVIKWVAQFNDECTYTGSYSMWQCTSSATTSAADTTLDYNYMIENIFIGNSSSNISGTTTSTITNAQIITNMGFVNSNSYLTGVPLGASVQSVISSVSKASSDTTVTIKNTSSSSITTGTISTGMTMTLKTNNITNTYTFVVRGDVNGDGQISGVDYVFLRNYIDKKYSLTTAQYLASDASNDGTVNGVDYVRIRNYLDNKSTIIQ
ncbi:MAG: dockerin type I domain-containing protein, partial [Erysipelotrichaceae bacterium]|nr:dockerin type I domain-containing protein [Erysipelotrichaceae bacterium]